MLPNNFLDAIFFKLTTLLTSCATWNAIIWSVQGSQYRYMGVGAANQALYAKGLV